MSRLIDLTGQKFGRLTVIERAENIMKSRVYWLCKCECGNTAVVRGSCLQSNTTQSCGCLQKEKASKANLKDLTGQLFGKLTVLDRVDNAKDGQVQYLCLCDCGNTTVVRSRFLLTGHTKSCGCYQKELASKNKTHGESHTRLYSVWNAIKQRCLNKHSTAYKYYGQRGITICEDWANSYTAFSNWAYANGYDKLAKYGECTIERINVDGNYEPNNCKWVSIKSQCNNRRSNRLITYNNKTQTLMQWSKELKINYNTLRRRIVRDHWTVEKAFNIN